MIRILAYGVLPNERSKIRLAADKLMASVSVSSYAVAFVAELDVLKTAFERAREGFYDIVLVRLESDAAEALDALRAVRASDRAVGIAVLADVPDYAAEAFELHADGYGLTSDSYEGFEQALRVSVLKAAARRSATIGVRSDAGVGNLTIDEIEFVEASKKGPVVHLSTGRTINARGTLQSLFELLSKDERFVKAGGSFIVNLDNIRSLGESSAVFPDGETIIIPVRMRKPLREALMSYRLRPEYRAEALAKPI